MQPRAPDRPQRQRAVSCWVLSALSVPITVDLETRVSAALNIYSAHAHAFTTEDLHIAVRFASSAETSVLNAHDHDACRALVRQLTSALETRPLIDQAKGITMSVHACTADEASHLLLTEARRSNRILKDVAQDVVATVRSGLATAAHPSPRCGPSASQPPS